VKYGNYSVGNITLQLSGLDPGLKIAKDNHQELMMYRSKPHNLRDEEKLLM
jgi:hypothetical protein